MDAAKVQKAIAQVEDILGGLKGAHLQAALAKVEKLLLEVRQLKHTELPAPDSAAAVKKEGSLAL
jgi:hypothetical protein